MLCESVINKDEGSFYCKFEKKNGRDSLYIEMEDKITKKISTKEFIEPLNFMNDKETI